MWIDGGITPGSIGIIITMFTLFGGWWIKNDRQSIIFKSTLEKVQTDLINNRSATKEEIQLIRDEFKAQNASIAEIKLQLATIMASQTSNMMLQQLPNDLAKAVAAAMKGYTSKFGRGQDDKL